MKSKNIKISDYFGRFWIKGKGFEGFQGYYSSLDSIRPHFFISDWVANVTGFYINHIDRNKYSGFVRLSFFSSAPTKSEEVVNRFVHSNNLEIVQAESPNKNRISDPYGGKELRFRKYLSTYSLIGLDIMKADLLNAQCIFATFRWQIMRARRPYKPHFIKTFESQSPFYNSLSSTAKKQFWSDLEHWPNKHQVDWAHFFVNMVLGCDWKIGGFLDPQSSLSISGINQILERGGLIFNIPKDWNPQIS